MAIFKFLPHIVLISLMGFVMGAYARPGVYFLPSRTFFVSISYSIPYSLKDSLQPLETLSRSDGLFSSLRLIDGSSELSVRGLDLDFPTEFSFSRPGEFFELASTNGREDIVIPTRTAEDSVDVRSSMRDRARDIMSVVIALLFGIGCAALTASTLYLAWSLINNRCDFGSGDDEFEGYDGYVKIPISPEPVKVKEGYEGN